MVSVRGLDQDTCGRETDYTGSSVAKSDGTKVQKGRPRGSDRRGKSGWVRELGGRGEGGALGFRGGSRTSLREGQPVKRGWFKCSTGVTERRCSLRGRV